MNGEYILTYSYKSKEHPRKDHVRPEWVQSHSSIPSLTSVLDGGCFSFLFQLRLLLLSKGLQEVFIL